MALQLSKELRGVGVASECYAKITGAVYTITNPDSPDGITISVSLYYNKAARDADEFAYLEVENYVIEDDTIETRAAQYEYLKTLDEFAGAIDV